MSRRMSVQQFVEIIRALAISLEGTHECKCATLHTVDNPINATGHVRGCPVDEAVRLELAKTGTV